MAGLQKERIEDLSEQIETSGKELLGGLAQLIVDQIDLVISRSRSQGEDPIETLRRVSMLFKIAERLLVNKEILSNLGSDLLELLLLEEQGLDNPRAEGLIKPVVNSGELKQGEEPQEVPEWITKYLEDNPKHVYSLNDIFNASGRSPAAYFSSPGIKRALDPIINPYINKGGKIRRVAVPKEVFISACLAIGQVDSKLSEEAKNRWARRKEKVTSGSGGVVFKASFPNTEEVKRGEFTLSREEIIALGTVFRLVGVTNGNSLAKFGLARVGNKELGEIYEAIHSINGAIPEGDMSEIFCGLIQKLRQFPDHKQEFSAQNGRNEGIILGVLSSFLDVRSLQKALGHILGEYQKLHK